MRDAALAGLRAGVELDDGRTAPARVRRISADTIEITIHEGRKRQVKRMCEAVGHPVKRLERVAFGPLELGDLPRGRWRKLSAAEVDALSGRAVDRPHLRNASCERSSRSRRDAHMIAAWGTAFRRHAHAVASVGGVGARGSGQRWTSSPSFASRVAVSARDTSAGVIRTGRVATIRRTVNWSSWRARHRPEPGDRVARTASATATGCTPTPTSRSRRSAAR